MNSPQETNASETGRKPRHPGVAQYEGSTGKDWRTGKKLSHTELAARAEADELPQAETGRMEFPALLIMSIAGEIKTVEIIHFESTSDWWKGHAKDSGDFSVQVIPISTILRAQAMERALRNLLECCELNMDEMEPETLDAIQQAQDALP